MKDELGLQKRDVVELLTTWGATAQPGLADLLAVLATVGRSDARTLVRAILDTPGVTLPEGLRREASELVVAGEHATTPELEANLTALAGRLGEAVRDAVASGRGTLRDELKSWSRLLDASELDAVLQRVWRHESAGEVADHLTAARQLEQARGILGKARWRVDSELRGLLEEADASAAGRVRAVLERGDPVELLAARRELMAAKRGAVESRHAVGVEAARARVVELRDRVRSIADAGVGGTRELLAVALERTEALAGAVESGKSMLEQLTLWEQALGGLLQSAAEAPSGRAALGEALSAELRSEVDRKPEAGDLGSALENLVAATPAGGRAFVDAFARACAALNAHRAQTRAGLESAGAELRNAARKLEAELQRVAGDLSTERVVASRVLLERVEETIAGGDPSAVESLISVVQEQLDRVGEMTEIGQQHRRSHVAAERKRLRSEAQQLLRVEGRGHGRRVRALVERIDRADGKALERLAEDLAGVSRRVGNSVRLRTARVLDRFKKRGVNDGTVEELRAALDSDDLEVMAKLGGEKHRELLRVGRSRRILVGAAAVAIAAGVSYVMISRAKRAFPYELTLADSDIPCRLWFVQDGNVDHDLDCSTGRASVSLRRGSYEVFVNRRYTGRVIRVPGASEQDLRDIPVLPAP